MHPVPRVFKRYLILAAAIVFALVCSFEGLKAWNGRVTPEKVASGKILSLNTSGKLAIACVAAATVSGRSLTQGPVQPAIFKAGSEEVAAINSTLLRSRLFRRVKESRRVSFMPNPFRHLNKNKKLKSTPFSLGQSNAQSYKTESPCKIVRPVATEQPLGKS